MSAAPSLPGVTYVMPVLNEADYIASALASVLAQDYAGATEVVLVLGPSTDGTNDIVRRLCAADPRVRSVDNPRAHIPIGLNLAIRASTQPFIVRVDAHSALPDDYTRRAVHTLIETGAANVGGIMVAVGRPGLQAAVAWAYNSRLGLGGGAYHHADQAPGEAESAYLGVLRSAALAAVGGFDESLRRGEDWELNQRLRAAGYLVWLDPALRVDYWPRSTWGALTRQFYATGAWRGELVRRLRTRNSLRFFAPPALVIATASALVLAPLALTGTGGVVALVTSLAVAAGPVAYLGLLGWAALTGAATPADRCRRCGVLAVMHFAWGIGFLLGVARGAREVVDTSRARRL